MTDSLATSKARSRFRTSVLALFKGDPGVCGTDSIRWRIDYHLAQGEVAGRAEQAVVDRVENGALRWSDHAPVTVQYR
jgi:endonuclease/exonuclease/phosphatase family metal-dependent hydrolase